MTAISNLLRWFLSSPVWQGVAGIAQMLAAIFAIITILQARKMMKQSESAQRASVAPAWQLSNDPGRLHINGNIGFADIRIQNVGFGPACNLKVIFISNNNHHLNF